MVRDTPRFGLDDYEVGDRGWDHSDLVQFVDTHGIDRGPVADRPTQGTYPDELYLATDDKTLYRWDADADTWLAAIRAGLSDGEDFDGQGDAAFSNLASLGVAEGRVGADAYAGAGDRPVITNAVVDVTVDSGGGADYTSLQDALDDVPLLVRHRYTINVADGDYPEHAIVRPYLTGGVDTSQSAPADRAGLRVIGNQDTPSNVTVDSIMIYGSSSGAVNPYISGVRFTETSPYDDDDATIAAYGCNHVSLADVECRATGHRAVLAYASDMTINGVDIGDNRYEHGFTTKHSGEMYIVAASGAAVTSPYTSDAGTIHYDGSNAPDGREFSNGNGYILNTDSGIVHGINGFVYGVRADTKTRDLSNVTPPEDLVIFYDDGSNTPARATPCVADTETGVWRPVHDPDAGAFTY